jgi:hypothetical protein
MSPSSDCVVQLHQLERHHDNLRARNICGPPATIVQLLAAERWSECGSVAKHRLRFKWGGLSGQVIGVQLPGCQLHARQSLLHHIMRAGCMGTSSKPLSQLAPLRTFMTAMPTVRCCALMATGATCVVCAFPWKMGPRPLYSQILSAGKFRCAAS